MRHSILLAAAIVFGITVSSCKKDKTNSAIPDSNQASQLNYQLVASNTNGSGQKGSAIANVQWTSGYANPRVVKFEAKQGNTEIEYKSTNDEQIDLMSPVAVGFGNFTIPPGTYDEIELKITLDKGKAGPALQLNGQYNNGTTTIPVVLEIDESAEIKTEQSDVIITDNTSFTAVTTIDLGMFTDGITEAQLIDAKLTNGAIVISRTSNILLYYKIVKNFKDWRYRCKFHRR